jgi:homoserine O-acetyltransferase
MLDAGPGKPFDTDKYMVVCANVLGSCYGSTGPRSINPATGKPYGNDFPDVTIRDTVRLHMRMAKEGIGANSVACVVGGSMGKFLLCVSCRCTLSDRLLKSVGKDSI